MSLEPVILRAVDEQTAAASVSCFVCRSEFVLGPVYAWVNMEYGPYELCETCLHDLSELARKRELDIPLRDAWERYREAKSRYTEPMSTVAEVLSMTPEEERRLLEAAYLT